MMCCKEIQNKNETEWKSFQVAAVRRAAEHCLLLQKTNNAKKRRRRRQVTRLFRAVLESVPSNHDPSDTGTNSPRKSAAWSTTTAAAAVAVATTSSRASHTTTATKTTWQTPLGQSTVLFNLLSTTHHNNNNNHNNNDQNSLAEHETDTASSSTHNNNNDKKRNPDMAAFPILDYLFPHDLDEMYLLSTTQPSKKPRVDQPQKVQVQQQTPRDMQQMSQRPSTTTRPPRLAPKKRQHQQQCPWSLVTTTTPVAQPRTDRVETAVKTRPKPASWVVSTSNQPHASPKTTVMSIPPRPPAGVVVAATLAAAIATTHVPTILVPSKITVPPPLSTNNNKNKARTITPPPPPPPKAFKHQQPATIPATADNDTNNNKKKAVTTKSLPVLVPPRVSPEQMNPLASSSSSSHVHPNQQSFASKHKTTTLAGPNRTKMPHSKETEHLVTNKDMTGQVTIQDNNQFLAPTTTRVMGNKILHTHNPNTIALPCKASITKPKKNQGHDFRTLPISVSKANDKGKEVNDDDEEKATQSLHRPNGTNQSLQQPPEDIVPFTTTEPDWEAHSSNQTLQQLPTNIVPITTEPDWEVNQTLQELPKDMVPFTTEPDLEAHSPNQTLKQPPKDIMPFTAEPDWEGHSSSEQQQQFRVRQPNNATQEELWQEYIQLRRNEVDSLETFGVKGDSGKTSPVAQDFLAFLCWFKTSVLNGHWLLKHQLAPAHGWQTYVNRSILLLHLKRTDTSYLLGATMYQRPSTLEWHNHRKKHPTTTTTQLGPPYTVSCHAVMELTREPILGKVARKYTNWDKDHVPKEFRGTIFTYMIQKLIYTRRKGKLYQFASIAQVEHLLAHGPVNGRDMEVVTIILDETPEWLV